MNTATDVRSQVNLHPHLPDVCAVCVHAVCTLDTWLHTCANGVNACSGSARGSVVHLRRNRTSRAR